MKFNPPILLCGLVLLLISCTSPDSQPTNQTIIQDAIGEKLDSLLTPYVIQLRNETSNSAGLAIAITTKEQILYARTFGYSDIENKVEADLNTLFHIASVSKPFTAMGIAKLVEQGKLTLDDPIVKHVPEFQMVGNDYTSITIRHVLTHTSGIPRHVSTGDWENPVYGPLALEQNLVDLKNFELEFEPGTQFNYSNAAFDLLGVLIARVADVPFHTFVSSQFLEPLEMYNSSYLKPKDSLPSNWAIPYSFGLTDQEWTPYPYTEKFFPSSGVQSSLLDMCNWGMFHLNKGIFRGTKVLDSTVYNMVVSPHYKTPWGDHIGLGWFLQSYVDRPILMHTGNDTGFESIMYIYPEDGYSIVVMANRDLSRTGRIINAASEILFDKPTKPYAVSAKYPFAHAYREEGIENAQSKWDLLANDTTDIFSTDNNDLLTMGAVLENGKHWKESKEILEFYLTFNDQSTYAWRLLGNDYLELGDTVQARFCYEKTLKINPNYTPGKKALENLLKGNQ